VPSIHENRETWGRPESWTDDGDVWSRGWGGPRSQWSSWIEPRLREAAGPPPYGTVVEIGCGHGRWTQFLAEAATQVIALDVAPACIDACRARFDDHARVVPVLCDGRSIPAVADRSVDLVFSFDSLVHADAEALDAYLAEISRVLRTDGVAWLHHSNLGACRGDRSAALRRVGPLHRLLVQAGVLEPELHWRDASVDADLVVASAARHGLVCTSQELLGWATRRALIDCVSVLVRAEGRHAGAPLRRWENRAFDEERDAAERATRGAAPES
jgi:SAM-dependent methyltransferase